MIKIKPSGSTTPLPVGKVLPLMRQMTALAGSWEIQFQLDADTVLFSLWVGELQSGTFDVSIYTATQPSEEPGTSEETLIASFPTLTVASTDLLLKKAATALSTVLVRITATGPATFDIRAKGLGTGDASVKIEGANNWEVGQQFIGTTPALVIPASLTDRAGLVIKNFSTGFLYLAEVAAKADASIGYPIGAGESIAFDLTAGQEIWGVAGSGIIDIRFAQAGG